MKLFSKVTVQNARGFSLIEILIALVLLAFAGTFVAGKIFNSLTEGQQNSARIQMSNLEARLKEYRRKCGAYPTTDQGLEALVQKPTSGRECKDYPPSGFIDGDQVPQDPWNNDFVYESDGKSISLMSLGADREVGGEDGDADIPLRGKAQTGAASSSTEESAPQE